MWRFKRTPKVSAGIRLRNSPSGEKEWVGEGLGYHQPWFICRFQFMHSSHILASFWSSSPSAQDGDYSGQRGEACHQYNICPSPPACRAFCFHLPALTPMFWPCVHIHAQFCSSGPTTDQHSAWSFERLTIQFDKLWGFPAEYWMHVKSIFLFFFFFV